MANMSSFEMLALVASQNYVQNFESEKRVPESKKLSRKRHASSDTWTFEEIKSLSPKALVGRFALFTSDEITKKYYYRCRLLPGKCAKTESSFGNEQRAFKLMKAHLKAHLNENSSELDHRVFAKSPALEDKLNWSNSVQKPSKVPSKAKFVSETESSNDSEFSSDCFKSKKMLEFGHEYMSTARRKQFTPKHKSVQHNGWSLPTFFPLPSFQELPSNVNLLPTDENLDQFSNMQAAEFSSPRMYDHDYADKNPFPFSTVNTFNEEPCMQPLFTLPPRKRPKIQKQFVIKTPKFPYLHDMEEYVVSQIVEVDCDGNIVKRRQRTETNCLDIKNYLLSKKKEEKTKFEMSNGIESLPTCETLDFTGTVLECVENKVSKKCSAAFAAKISYSSSDNDENSENIRKVRKELALKHITQLISKKKKKQYQGPLNCKLCDDGRLFTAVASLMHHYRSHAGIKLYLCDICQGTFTRQHSLNYHIMIHQNRSRFTCDVCGRTFRHPSHFKEHMRRHTGETPFQCSICDMLFKTRNTYKRHLRMQHNKILTAHGIVDNAVDEAPTSSKRSKKRNSQ